MSKQEHERVEEENRRLEELLSIIRGRTPQEPGAKGVIQQIDFTRLLQYILGDRGREDIEELREVEEILRRIEAESRKLVDVYTRDGMGRIIHPLHGDSIVLARLGEIAALLIHIIRVSWRRAIQLLRGNAPPEKVLEALRDAEWRSRLAYLIFIEAYDKLLTLLMINAPPGARPPLANAALGYEIIQ